MPLTTLFYQHFLGIFITSSSPISTTFSTTIKPTETKVEKHHPTFGDWIGGVIGGQFPMNITDIQPDFVISSGSSNSSSEGTRKFGRPDLYHQNYYQNVGILTPTQPTQLNYNVGYNQGSSGYPSHPVINTQNLVPQARNFQGHHSGGYYDSPVKNSPSPVYYPKG